MIFEKFNHGIQFEKNEDFDAFQILNCGQIFRFEKINDANFVFGGIDFFVENGFVVHTRDCEIVIEETKTQVRIFGNPEFICDFFDLETEYAQIKAQLSKFTELKDAIAFGHGIRILKQDWFEMIVSFMISQNNNIPKIKSTIEKFCAAHGKNMGTFHAFPSLFELSQTTEEEWVKFGAGYRSKFLAQLFENIQKNNEKLTQNHSTNSLKQTLLSFFGIGNKVADCILLFGFHRLNVFPTDTWVLKATNGKNATKTAQQNAEKFQEIAGYAQQYLFNYAKNHKKN